MDTITHAISGAVIGAATAGRDTAQMPKRALWGGLFAAFPDSDFVMALFVDHFTYLNEHRGYTHSVILLPAWAALLGWLGARFAGRWRDMAALAAAALAAHILGDLITSYGTKVFKPVYDAPLAYPITFIIDPYFTLILLTGLVAALWKRRPSLAVASTLILGAYLVLQAILQQQAMEVGREYATAEEQPGSPVIALPQPLSPLNWKVIVVLPEGYRRAHVNLLADDPSTSRTEDAALVHRLYAAYRPVGDLEWTHYARWPERDELRELAQQAWTQPAFEGFRQFALLPYVSRIRGDTNRVCVWFNDLRFALPGLRPPFEYAMCRNERGEWALDRDAS